MEPLEWSKKGQQEVAKYIGQRRGESNCLYPVVVHRTVIAENFRVELSKGRPSETKGVGGCDEVSWNDKGCRRCESFDACLLEGVS